MQKCKLGQKVEKGYGRWWDTPFRLVSSKPSSDPSNNLEPTFEEEEQDEAGPSQINTSTQTPHQVKRMVPKRPNGASGKSSYSKANLISILNTIVMTL